MTETPRTPEFVVRWMSFKEYGDQITRLERRVYPEEQGSREGVASSPQGTDGLHLGAFFRDELVSVVSAWVHQPGSEDLASHGLPPAQGPVVQFNACIGLPEHHGSGVGELLFSTVLRAIYENIRPQYCFLLLRGAQAELQPHYIEVYGFEHHAATPGPGGDQAVTLLSGERRIRGIYLKARKMNEALIARLGIVPRSLVCHLEETGRTSLIAIEKLKKDNLYMAPLSLKDEMPRLSAQTRVLYGEQQPRLSAVNFPPAPARLLDVGAGPGVYLSMLGRQPKLRGYELVGLDQSAEMVMYARLNQPKLRWIHASVYDTGEPSESYDVVHSNCMFIHLLNPALGLRELGRILKPGGLLYVLDVNDSTFEGPPVVARLVQLHNDLYEGNRNVLNSLPHLAREQGLELVQSFSTKARNTGAAGELSFSTDNLVLDRLKFWGLFSFLGQREELSEQYKAAQDFYFGSSCEISICIQTHVYRKLDERSEP